MVRRTESLDFELEMGMLLGGKVNKLGERIKLE